MLSMSFSDHSSLPTSPQVGGSKPAETTHPENSRMSPPKRGPLFEGNIIFQPAIFLYANFSSLLDVKGHTLAVAPKSWREIASLCLYGGLYGGREAFRASVGGKGTWRSKVSSRFPVAFFKHVNLQMLFFPLLSASKYLTFEFQ